jgi:hypothetical protein
MVGLAFLANGVSSLLQHRARQLAEQTDGRWLGALSIPERSLLETIDVLGVVGSIGLAIAGTFILVRITRYVILAPIGTRAMATARRQIALALDREASQRPEAQPLVEQ